MRVEFTVDFNLSEEQITETQKNPLSFVYNHIEVKGFDKNDYNIVRVVNKDIMPYGAYGLNDKIVDWLNKLKIYRIEKISTFTYSQIKSTQVQEIRKAQYSFSNSYFVPAVIEVMKKRNLNFKDIDICDLIPLKEVTLSARAKNPLIKRGINYIQDIPLFTRNDISKSDTFGEKCQRELEDVMKQYGIWYYEYNAVHKNTENQNIENDLRLSYSAHRRLIPIKTEFLENGSYSLANKVINWLKDIGIDYLDNLKNLSYEEFRLGERNAKKNSFNIEYLEMKKLIDKMIEFEIDFRDLKPYNLIPIDDIEISVRTYQCLYHTGFLYLQDLALFKISEISKIRNLTVKCRIELEEYLARNGMKFKDE